jgi:hypothetical protein
LALRAANVAGPHDEAVVADFVKAVSGVEDDLAGGACGGDLGGLRPRLRARDLSEATRELSSLGVRQLHPTSTTGVSGSWNLPGSRDMIALSQCRLLSRAMS